MAVDSTLLMREVSSILESGQGVSHYHVECVIKAGDEWITPTRLDLYSLERDYEHGYGDVLVLEMIMGLGTYAYKLFPKRDQLWVDITSTPLYENSDAQRSDIPRRQRRYRAILMDQENPGLVGRMPQASSEDDLNLTAPKKVEMQLVDEGLYQSRMITVGRLYRKATPMHALKSLFTETTALVDGRNQQQIKGVEIVDGFNQTQRDHVIIPHGTPLFHVPDLLQTDQGGLYAAGIGCYLQNQQWWVFPPYNTQRFTKARRTLTVLNIPPNRYYGAERTYRATDRQVIIVAAGDMSTNDDGRYQQLNDGNAVRFTDARRLLVYGDTDNNKTQLRRQDNVFEFEGPQMDGGLSNARWSKERASANPFPHYTRMAKRNGRYMTVEWLHGDASLLEPGMPVKFLTAAENALQTFYGVLLGVHEQRIPSEQGVNTRRYPASVRLKVFITREEGV